MSYSRTFIAPCLRRLFLFLEHKSPLNAFYYLTKRCGKRWLWIRAWRRVETYVLICLSIELVFLILVGLPPFKPWWLLYSLVAILIFLLLWRLSDIIAQWFKNYIFGSGRLLSVPRFLILTLINYLEVAIIFGIIAFVFKNGFRDDLGNPFASVLQSLRYSIGVITTMGSMFEPSSWYGYLIFFVEIGCAVLFLVAIIHIALSFFPKR